MHMRFSGTVFFFFFVLTGSGLAAKDPERINKSTDTDKQAEEPAVGPASKAEDVLQVQVLLDRAGISPGEIDATYGENTRRAVRVFQKTHNLAVTGLVDAMTWSVMQEDTEPPMVKYTITKNDLAGPFHGIPDDMQEQAKLKRLGYFSPLEELGERFHIQPELLEELNPGAKFDQAETVIRVPNIQTKPPAKASSVVVDGIQSSVEAYDASGKLIAYYPASTGSEHDPLPVGTWKVTAVRRMPVFRFNPDLFWNDDPSKSKADIPPGPNNPVGVVWIGLSKENYGIHGTPDPTKVGKSESHGCIRLTNWDAEELSRMVEKGTPVIIRK